MVGHNQWKGKALTVFDSSKFHEEPDPRHYRTGETPGKPPKSAYDPAGQFTDDEIACALQEAGGLHFLAAQVLGKGCTGISIKRRIARSPFLQAAQEEYQGDIGDRAELAVFKGIRANKLDAAKFYLQTRGKDRGYSTKGEDAAASSAAAPAFDLSRLSPEQLTTLLKAMNSPTPPSQDTIIEADYEEITK